MNTGSKRGPTLRRHKRSGHGYARFNGKQLWFGPFDDPTTHARFATFKAEWEARGRQLSSADADDESLTVADLVARYLAHAEVYYRKPDGTPTHEVVNTRYTVQPLLDEFGSRPVVEVNLRCLKQVRSTMVESGLCRRTVNQRVSRLVRMFAWGAEEDIVPPEVYGSLRALRPLKRGRSNAPETEPVRAVKWGHVEVVLPRVTRPVRAMILLQWHTGMRPGEVVQLRPMDLDRSGRVWLYRPARHKTEHHHGRERVIALGPRAQDVVGPFLLRVPRPDPEDPLFSPQQAMEEARAERRKNRQTPLWPSHQRSRRKRNPKKRPGRSYTVSSFRKAIKAACEAAKIPVWTPNQLRHAAATRLRRELGLEAARVVLGHSSSAVTEVYAELDQVKAVEVMGELG